MAQQVDCSNYRLIMGQWYQKTPGGGMIPIPASRVPAECKRGGVADMAGGTMVAAKKAKPARGAKNRATGSARKSTKRKPKKP